MRWLALAVILCLVGCGGGADTAASGAATTTGSGPTSTVTTAAGGVVTTAPLTGAFGTVSVTVVLPDGTRREWCLLLADTDARRSRGLMGVTELAGYDGMAFRFGTEARAAFYMYRTLIPLSVVFFDGAGRFVSAADMVPCPATDAADCPLTTAAAPYTDAVEVPRGGLSRLGLVDGARVAFGGPCRPRG